MKGLITCCAVRQAPSIFYILILCFFVLKNTVADEGDAGQQHHVKPPLCTRNSCLLQRRTPWQRSALGQGQAAQTFAC